MTKKTSIENYSFTSLDNDNILRTRVSARARYAYWVHAFHNGKLIVLGGYADEQEAQADNYARLDGKGEVIELPTIDPSRATQIIKKRMLDRGKTLDEALRRASHKGLKHDEQT